MHNKKVYTHTRLNMEKLHQTKYTWVEVQKLYLTKYTSVEVQDFRLHQKNLSDHEVSALELPAENSNKQSQ